MLGQVVDDQVDEFNLVRAELLAHKKPGERFLRGFAIEAYERSDKEPQPLIPLWRVRSPQPRRLRSLQASVPVPSGRLPSTPCSFAACEPRCDLDALAGRPAPWLGTSRSRYPH